MMKIRGNNVWPATVDSVVFSHPEVAEYVGRVYVDEQGRTEVEIRYATRSDATEGEAVEALTATMARRIKSRTNVTMRLRAVPRSELPTFEYKARRWTDERRQGYARQVART
jgi:phenylacetate-CoA ligase